MNIYFIILISILILLFLKQVTGYRLNMDISIVCLNSVQDFKKHNKHVFKFERSMRESYPLGNDRFHIDHGKDYFRFFNRLGDNHHYLFYHGKKIVGTCSMILRQINEKPVWYMCDLKVLSEYRNRRLLTGLFVRNLCSIYSKSNRLYGISMNPNTKMNSIVSRFNWLGFKKDGDILIYSLDHDQMLKAQDILKNNQEISYYSPKGIKDIILESNSKPLNLLHLTNQKGPISKPVKGYTHMFCLHQSDKTIFKLKKIGITTDTSASIICYNMDGPWDFISTADI